MSNCRDGGSKGMTGDCGLQVRPGIVGLQGNAVLGGNRFLGAALAMGCGSKAH